MCVQILLFSVRRVNVEGDDGQLTTQPRLKQECEVGAPPHATRMWSVLPWLTRVTPGAVVSS